MRLRSSPGLGRLAGVLLAAWLLVALAGGPSLASASPASPFSASSASSPATQSASASLGSLASASVASASLSPWRGGMDLYRAGVFSTQKTWYWCTAATVQISRNIVSHQAAHSASAQAAYFDWMRLRDRYRLPLTAGVDAAGWSAGFAHFVDRRYRLHASATFDAALRSAVTNLRKTNLPVALAVQHGNHAWLLTGFTATADPARTTRFTVTSVRVVGPLYGLQSSKSGYDMPPDTRLTPTQLRHYFTPWYYAPIRMVWDGTYVSIQPSAAALASTATSQASPAPAATPRPTPSRQPSPMPSLAASPDPALAAFGASPSPAAVAAVSASLPVEASPAPQHAALASATGHGVVAAALDPASVVALVVVGLLLLVMGVAALAARRRSRSS